MLNKREFLLIALIILVNLMSYFLVVPYVQNLENRHFNAGKTISKIYYVLSGVIFLFGLFKYKSERDLKTLLILVLFIVAFIYWGIKISNLYCLKCLILG